MPCSMRIHYSKRKGDEEYTRKPSWSKNVFIRRIENIINSRKHSFRNIFNSRLISGSASCVGCASQSISGFLANSFRWKCAFAITIHKSKDSNCPTQHRCTAGVGVQNADGHKICDTSALFNRIYRRENEIESILHNKINYERQHTASLKEWSWNSTISSNLGILKSLFIQSERMLLGYLYKKRMSPPFLIEVCIYYDVSLHWKRNTVILSSPKTKQYSLISSQLIDKLISAPIRHTSRCEIHSFHVYLRVCYANRKNVCVNSLGHVLLSVILISIFNYYILGFVHDELWSWIMIMMTLTYQFFFSASSCSPTTWLATEYPKYVSTLPYLTIGRRFSKLNALMSFIKLNNNRIEPSIGTNTVSWNCSILAVALPTKAINFFSITNSIQFVIFSSDQYSTLFFYFMLAVALHMHLIFIIFRLSSHNEFSFGQIYSVNHNFSGTAFFNVFKLQQTQTQQSKYINRMRKCRGFRFIFHWTRHLLVDACCRAVSKWRKMAFYWACHR